MKDKVKKSTLLASTLMVAVILFSLIYFQSTQATPDAMGNYVKFYLNGCDKCKITYCIDGGNANTVESCSFGWSDCSVGPHSICVNCPPNKSGTASFYCYGGEAQDVYIDMQPDGTLCPCAQDKK